MQSMTAGGVTPPEPSRLRRILHESAGTLVTGKTRYDVYAHCLDEWVHREQIGTRCSTVKPLVWCDGRQSVACIPFSWKDPASDPWEGLCGSGVLSPFWPVTPYKLNVAVDGVSVGFHSAAAAYEAQKWWHIPAVREDLAKALTHADIAAAGRRGSQLSGGRQHALFEKKASMEAALCARYEISREREMLLATNGTFLLCCHPGSVSRQFWSDGNGIGENCLGMLLMSIRDTLAQASGRNSTWPIGVVPDSIPDLLHDLAYFCRASASQAA